MQYPHMAAIWEQVLSLQEVGMNLKSEGCNPEGQGNVLSPQEQRLK